MKLEKVKLVISDEKVLCLTKLLVIIHDIRFLDAHKAACSRLGTLIFL